MKRQLAPVDGLEIIKAANRAKPTKRHYAAAWRTWTEWCEREAVDPFDATPNHVISYMTSRVHQGLQKLGHACGAISTVYVNTGKEPPTADPRVLATKLQLAGKPRTHIPTDQRSPNAIQRHDIWVNRFKIWCQSNGKSDLPAHPEHIAEFLRETARSYATPTMLQASSAIAWYHRDHGYPDPGWDPDVAAVRAVCRAQYKLRERPQARPELPSEAIQGLEIIQASNLSKNSQKSYSTTWKKWARWCQKEGVGPLHATPDNVTLYMATSLHQDIRGLDMTSTVITRVYQEDGRNPPSKDPRVITAKRESAGKPPLRKPDDQLSPDYARILNMWLKAFTAWCQSHHKVDLPADPETIAEFLQKTSEYNPLGSVRQASSAIARHHLDRGYPDTARYPQVLAAMSDITKQAKQSPQKPAGYGKSPGKLKREKGLQNNWRQWCYDHEKDPTLATPEQLVDYLKETSMDHSVTHRQRTVKAISAMYQGHNDPTSADQVRNLLAELKEQPPTGTGKKFKRGRLPTQEMPNILTQAPTPPPTGLTEADVARVQETMEAQIAPGTRRNYMQGGWAPYEEWCEGIGISTIDATPLHIQAYLTMLAKIWKPGSVNNSLTAIRYCYDHERPYYNPARDPVVTDIMEGIRRKNPSAPAQMDPIREVEFKAIRKVAQNPRPWETQRTATIRGAIDIAAIALMRDGLLRCDEAVRARWSHLKRETDGSGRLTVPTSKTDQMGKGAILFVSPGTMEALDTMRQIKHARASDTSTDDRIFQMGDTALYNHIREVCAQAGLQGRFGGHSPRIGMAQDLSRAGASIASMMTAGRWDEPSMPALYTRNTEAGQGAVAEYYDRDPERGKIKINPLRSYALIPRHTRTKFAK